MAINLTFDVRFADASGTGQDVDTDVYVELYEAGNTVAKETRVLGQSITAAIIQSSDGQGVFYSTVVDVSSYVSGDVTAKWFAKQDTVPLDSYPYVEVLAYPTPGLLSTSGIGEYIRSALGHPSIVVELESSHINTVVQEALVLYNTYLAQTQIGVVTLLAQKYAYSLPMVGSRGVYDVSFVHKETAPLLGDPLFGRLYPRASRMEFDMYVLGLSMWETLRRVTGIKPIWEWRGDTKQLFINVGDTNIAGGTLGSYYVTFKYRADVALSDIPAQHQHLFLRYCLARAKLILSRITGKFGGMVPGPGVPLTMDNSTLRQEGITESDEFEKRIRSLQPPALPLRF